MTLHHFWRLLGIAPKLGCKCKMRRILLTCGRIPSALFLARALHRAGAEVHVADSFPVHICKASNAVHTNHKTTSPTISKSTYKTEILNIIAKYKIDLVIPVFEDGIFLSEFYTDIAGKCKVMTSNFKLMLQLHNKFNFITLASSLGLPTPITYKYDFPIDNFEFIKSTKYITKKIFSRAGSGVEIFEAGEPINASLPANGEHIIQEFIAGQMVCTCSYVYNGELILHTAYKQLIVTPNGTAAICFEAIENFKIQNSIAAFVSKIAYNGWISFDIIQKENGEFYYIECNPRTSLGICLFTPEILAQTLLKTNIELKFKDAVKIGTKGQIFLVSIECIVRRFFKRTLELKELKYLLQAKDITFDRFDFVPCVYQFICYVYVKYLALKSKTSFLFAATSDLEWN